MQNERTFGRRNGAWVGNYGNCLNVRKVSGVIRCGSGACKVMLGSYEMHSHSEILLFNVRELFYCPGVGYIIPLVSNPVPRVFITEVSEDLKGLCSKERIDICR